MVTREDIRGVNVSATIKPMDTGEIRCRLRLGVQLETRIKAVHATKASRFGWQGHFHRHRLQRESYSVVSGVLGAVSWNQETGEVLKKVLQPLSQVWFQPGLWHDIYTTPDSEFVTFSSSEIGIDVEADREVFPQSEIPLDVRGAQAEIEESVRLTYRDLMWRG